MAVLVLAGLHLAIMWPGLLTWDAIRQYGQALSGQYDDWHPPAMNWLWRQLLVFGHGPAPMLVVQVALYWAGFGLLIAAMARDQRWLTAAALIALALLPMPLVVVGTVLKDSLMAGALLLAWGLMAWWRAGWARATVASLLLAAATLRFNAVAACLPLMVALAPTIWRRTPARLILTTLAAVIPLAAALPLANKALSAKKSGVELSLVIFDLGGITRFSGTDAFPPVAVDDLIATNADCYTPVSWDRYAWWGPDPCPIGFTTVRSALGDGAIPWWSRAITAHPAAYTQHRMAHMNANLRLLVRDADLPALPTRTDPNPWGYRTPSAHAFASLAAVATRSVASPLGWPVCWIALGLGLFILRPWREATGLAWPILLSSLLYAASFIPLSVASEVRYHLWTELGIGVAAVLILSDPIATRSHLRLATALGPLVLVVMATGIARVT